MATIKFSSLVSDVRGKIGGVVFARGANGSYVRSWAKSSNKLTEAAIRQRLNFAYYSGKWRGLDDEDRKAWIDSVSQFPYQNRVGETSFYTGFQLYLKTNLWLESAALDQ